MSILSTGAPGSNGSATAVQRNYRTSEVERMEEKIKVLFLSRLSPESEGSSPTVVKMERRTGSRREARSGTQAPPPSPERNNV